jgi:hypothetical protein
MYLICSVADTFCRRYVSTPIPFVADTFCNCSFCSWYFLYFIRFVADTFFPYTFFLSTDLTGSQFLQTVPAFNLVWRQIPPLSVLRYDCIRTAALFDKPNFHLMYSLVISSHCSNLLPSKVCTAIHFPSLSQVAANSTFVDWRYSCRLLS